MHKTGVVAWKAFGIIAFDEMSIFKDKAYLRWVLYARAEWSEIEVDGMMDKLKGLRLQYWAPSIPWMLLIFVIFFNMQSSSVFATSDDSSQFVESGLVARGHDVDELDSKHLFLSEKLHQMFNPLDMGANWQVSANYLWMPPLDVSGQGLVLYRNAGKFILEVDAQHVSGEPPSGAWIMLFNERGDLINDVYFSGTESREAHVIYIGDMDHDGHLEWLLWGANVIGGGRDNAKIAWQDIENKFSSYFNNPTVELYVMNEAGVLEYKRGKPWATHYRFAADLYCPFLDKSKYSFDTSNSPSASEMRDQRMTPRMCLTALEGTEDEEYIWQSLVNLQKAAKANWEINYIANSLDEEGYPFIKQVLDKYDSNHIFS